MAANDKLLTKKDLMEVLADFWEQVIYPEFQKTAKANELNKLRVEIKSETRDIKRKLVDLELDTPTKSEFNRLEKRVRRLEDRYNDN
jgi:hypothetical protein